MAPTASLTREALNVLSLSAALDEAVLTGDRAGAALLLGALRTAVAAHVAVSA